MGRTQTGPIGALGDSLIEDMANSLAGLSLSVKNHARANDPDKTKELEETPESPTTEASTEIATGDADEAPTAADDTSTEEGEGTPTPTLDSTLDSTDDNNSDGTVQNEETGSEDASTPTVEGNTETEGSTEEVPEEGTDPLEKVASTEPESEKKGSKLNQTNRDILAQIQMLLQKIEGSEESDDVETPVVIDAGSDKVAPVEEVKVDASATEIETLRSELVEAREALETQTTLSDDLQAQLQTKSEELDTMTQKVGETVTQLEQKFAEFEAKVGSIKELDASIAEKTQEYERITKMKLPRPDEARPEVVVKELLGTNKARKSYVGMTNADFLTLDRIDQ